MMVVSSLWLSHAIAAERLSHRAQLNDWRLMRLSYYVAAEPKQNLSG
ncbi:MAG: hypothetical protein AAFO87_13235 [Cyanobacteria bacterium J06607_6]